MDVVSLGLGVCILLKMLFRNEGINVAVEIVHAADRQAREGIIEENLSSQQARLMMITWRRLKWHDDEMKVAFVYFGGRGGWLG